MIEIHPLGVMPRQMNNLGVGQRAADQPAVQIIERYLVGEILVSRHGGCAKKYSRLTGKSSRTIGIAVS
jgi:hypothetical protein